MQAKKNIIKLDFYGSITDLYNAADIFIMPSYFEGWSIAATEALYCGLPIIHSKCGSAIELVRFGQNGLMISNPAGEIENCSTEKLNESMGNRVPVNTNELYSAMKEIATNLLYWKERRSLIASSALQIYSKKSMIDSYIKCFEEIVTK